MCYSRQNSRQVVKLLATGVYNLLLAMGLMTASFSHAELLLTSNGFNFGPDDNLTISIGITQTETIANPVDIYFVLVAPDGETAFFFNNPSNPTPVQLKVSEPNTWQPLLTDVQLSAGLDTGLIPFFSANVSAGLGTGDYTAFLVTASAGTLNFLEVKTASFRVLTNSIKANLGVFSGSWTNTTFGSTGAANLIISEISPGVLEGTLDLDGMVGGLLNPPAETRKVVILDETGLIDSTSEDSLINGTWRLRLTPTGEITIEVKDIGMGFVNFDATGVRVGDTVNLEYDIGFASGTVTGERQ